MYRAKQESRKAQEVRIVGSRSNGRDLLRDREVLSLWAVGLKSNGSRGSRVLNGAGVNGKGASRTIKIRRRTAIASERKAKLAGSHRDSWLKPKPGLNPSNSANRLGFDFELELWRIFRDSNSTQQIMKF